jgi:membrane-bound lytic murein transglycosylase B
MHRFSSLAAGLSLLLLSLPGIAAEAPQLAPEVQKFAAEVASRHGLATEEVSRILAQAENLEDVIRPKFQRSAEATWPWHRYRKNFLSRARIENGFEFWQARAKLFEQAEREFGISQAVLAAIVGVETNYGVRPGKIRVLDSLYTQAFHYPERQRFGRAQLEDFLVLAVREKLDPLEVKGSYAGAMGQPQFIPSSYRNYAVDFDGDGRRDLWNSDADVIGSVANYFARHKWLAGKPVASPVSGVTEDHASLVTLENIKPKPPHLKIADLKRANIQITDELPAGELASLIQFTTTDGSEHWVGLHNFYVITRYNHSNLYAMAVYQLSQEIQALHDKENERTESASKGN